MTTKEVAQFCGVSEKTVYNNASKANVVLEHGKAKDWTEDEVKRLQLVLMNNQISQGTQVSTVKSTVETGFQSGLTIRKNGFYVNNNLTPNQVARNRLRAWYVE